MNFGVVIEVAIGVIFIWLILSLSAIQFQEWIASWLKFREKDLESVIGQMLANPRLVDEFYKHPIIQGMSRKPGKKPAYIPPREFVQTLFNIITTAGTEKSVIQQVIASIKVKVVAKQLAGSLDKEKTKEAKKNLEKLIQEIEKLAATEAKTIRDQISDLAAYKAFDQTPEIKTALAAIPDTVEKYLEEFNNAGLSDTVLTLTPVDIEKGIIAMGKINPSLERSMKTLLAGVYQTSNDLESALATARANVESWFNSSMERLSGQYKRRSQVIAFIIGLVLSIALSVDSIALVQRLWIDPTVRAALLENASAFQLPETNTLTTTDDPATAATQPPTTTGAATESPTTTPAVPTTTATPAPVIPPSDTIQNFQVQFEGLELPLGWEEVPTTNAQKVVIRYCAFIPEADPLVKGIGQWLPNWAWWTKTFQGAPANTLIIQGVKVAGVCYRPKGTTVPLTSTNPTYEDALKQNWRFAWLLGILISAAATTQGAPFWFDILNKLINLRGAGARPPTSEEEATPKKKS